MTEIQLDPTKYQIFLCTCPAVFPFSFATHPWFVINAKGEVSRWEVSMFRRKRELSYGHLNKDLLPIWQGIPILPFLSRFFWKGKIVAHIEGDNDSLAADMVNFVAASVEQYPYQATYSLRNQNSNTYAQWVLSKFPEANIALPWNAFGKKRVLS